MAGEHIPRSLPLCSCGMLAEHHRPSHNPRAWPLCTCGARAEYHRVKHLFRGTDTLCECGLPLAQHLSNGKGYRYPYVGIDGEGIGRKPHRYVLLTASDESGVSWSLEDLEGIGSRKALQWIVSTLYEARVFSFSFGYDITCILKDLPNETIHKLLRPSLRYVRGKLRPVHWRGFALDWLQGRLTISSQGRRVVIWDIFKFFQCSFVKTLRDWDIPTLDIDAMKLKRGRFRASEMPAIQAYCRDECKQLATLARKLIQTHRDVGLTLQAYYGAGSTASAAITKMKADDYRKDPLKAMIHAIACAFGGGRFEHSVIGIIKPCYGADISAAYPYQLYQLPCLMHGKWSHVTTHVKAAIAHATTALVRYRYTGRIADCWAPFSNRNAKGTICYPYRGEGWAWLPEILAAVKADWGKVELLEAWVYNTPCNCRPFAQVADYYRRRTELGKDAAGIVLKLGINGIAGKLMQSKGPKPKHQCWIWAGLVTSGTRAQVVDAIAGAKDPRDIVAVATDGVYSRSKLVLPRPIDTGTYDLPKPLGGWEQKSYPEGMLFVKPGIYTSLADGDIRARGIGRRALEESKTELIRAYKRGKREFTVTVDRFHGAKTSINSLHRRSARYGQWSRMPIRIAFRCPNRTESMGLLSTDTPSHPYSRSMLSPEKLEAIIAEAIQYEQP